MYAVGKVLRKINDYNHFLSLPASTRAEVVSLFERCISVQYLHRPDAERCFEIVNKLTMTIMVIIY